MLSIRTTLALLEQRRCYRCPLAISVGCSGPLAVAGRLTVVVMQEAAAVPAERPLQAGRSSSGLPNASEIVRV